MKCFFKEIATKLLLRIAAGLGLTRGLAASSEIHSALNEMAEKGGDASLRFLEWAGKAANAQSTCEGMDEALSELVLSRPNALYAAVQDKRSSEVLQGSPHVIEVIAESRSLRERVCRDEALLRELATRDKAWKRIARLAAAERGSFIFEENRYWCGADSASALSAVGSWLAEAGQVDHLLRDEVFARTLIESPQFPNLIQDWAFAGIEEEGSVADISDKGLGHVLHALRVGRREQFDDWVTNLWNAGEPSLRVWKECYRQLVVSLGNEGAFAFLLDLADGSLPRGVSSRLGMLRALQGRATGAGRAWKSDEKRALGELIDALGEESGEFISDLLVSIFFASAPEARERAVEMWQPVFRGMSRCCRDPGREAWMSEALEGSGMFVWASEEGDCPVGLFTPHSEPYLKQAILGLEGGGSWLLGLLQSLFLSDAPLRHLVSSDVLSDRIRRERGLLEEILTDCLRDQDDNTVFNLVMMSIAGQGQESAPCLADRLSETLDRYGLAIIVEKPGADNGVANRLIDLGQKEGPESFLVFLKTQLERSDELKQSMIEHLELPSAMAEQMIGAITPEVPHSETCRRQLGGAFALRGISTLVLRTGHLEVPADRLLLDADRKEDLQLAVRLLVDSESRKMSILHSVLAEIDSPAFFASLRDNPRHSLALLTSKEAFDFFLQGDGVLRRLSDDNRVRRYRLSKALELDRLFLEAEERVVQFRRYLHRTHRWLAMDRSMKARIISSEDQLLTGKCELKDALADVLFEGDELKLREASLHFPDRSAAIILIEEILANEDYYIPNDDTAGLILDCGSHFGLSLYYYKMMFPMKRVICFEPSPRAYAVLKKNIDSNGWKNVECLNTAISDREGKHLFHEQTFQTMAGSLEAQPNGAELKRIEVSTVKLGPYLEEDVDFLKLDLEGEEMKVLKDIRDSLPRVRSMFCEYHEATCDASLEEVLGLLKEEGFSLKVFPSAFYMGLARKRPLSFAKRPFSYSIFAERVTKENERGSG